MQGKPISTSGECAPHDDARRRRAGRLQRLVTAALTITAGCLAGMAGPSVAGAHGHTGSAARTPPQRIRWRRRRHPPPPWLASPSRTSRAAAPGGRRPVDREWAEPAQEADGRS